MQVYIAGNPTPIDLQKENFVHSGGEGEVFIRDNLAFKIYHEVDKMIERGRIIELSAIPCSNVVTPRDFLLNSNNKPIGYTMQSLPNTFALSRLFTNDFRKQHSLYSDSVFHLIQNMRETFEKIHESGCLVVDGNEQNYLVSDDFKNVYFIDTDSFQTPAFPAKAYSDSTLDPYVDKNSGVNSFNKDSDWFIFAIISCQLLIGTHPFKGSYKGTNKRYKRGDIRTRMEDKVSVFNKNVKVNSAVRDFNLIPDNYLAWFKDIFEEGLRTPPPHKIGTTQYMPRKGDIGSTDTISINELTLAAEEILNVYLFNGDIAYKTKKCFSYAGNEYNYSNPNTEFIVSIRGQIPYLVKCDNGSLLLFNTQTSEVFQEMSNLKSIFVHDNRLYGITQDRLIEYEIIEIGNRFSAVIRSTEEIMPYATQVFDGVIAQNIMGSSFFSLLISEGQLAQVHIKEADKTRIINAKFENGILVLVIYNSAEYKKLVIKFDGLYSSYSIFMDDPVDSFDINFCVLKNGVSVLLDEDKTLNIFDKRLNKNNVKKVSMTDTKMNLKLLSNESNLVGYSNKKIVSLKML